MAQVVFQYNDVITTILCRENQKISETFNNFAVFTHIDGNEINYYYNGKLFLNLIKI